MRKLILTALMAAVAIPAVALPTAANAQSRAEVRHDRRELREERRELRHARRYGDRHDVRREHRDVREARRELRQDRRDRRWARDAWRDYRRHHRALYARGHWRAPFRYYHFNRGVRIAPAYYGQRYWIGDPWRYRLPPAGRYQRWVRHYDDVLLVDYRRGIVIDVIRDFYW